MPDVNMDKAAFEAVLKLGRSMGEPVVDEKVHFTVIPDGFKLASLKDLQFPGGLRPDRISNTVTIQDTDSFNHYIETFGDHRTRIFADPDDLTFSGIIDYHGAGDCVPEFLSHRAVYKMLRDDRWNIWANKNEHVFTQTTFAEFLEDNASDIHDPPAARMLEVARDLHATIDACFDSKVKPVNGAVQIKYTEDFKASVGANNLDIPETFDIRIPVFYGEEPTIIKVRLRYRITASKLTFFYKMYREKEILQAAFHAAADSIALKLQREILFGSVD